MITRLEGLVRQQRMERESNTTHPEQPLTTQDNRTSRPGNSQPGAPRNSESNNTPPIIIASEPQPWYLAGITAEEPTTPYWTPNQQSSYIHYRYLKNFIFKLIIRKDILVYVYIRFGKASWVYCFKLD